MAAARYDVTKLVLMLPFLCDYSYAMAGYVPWFGKKREILRKQEREFSALLQTNAAPMLIAEAAEKVRTARLRYLKARRAQISPSEKNISKVENFDRETQYWEKLAVETIVEIYHSKSQTSER